MTRRGMILAEIQVTGTLRETDRDVNYPNWKKKVKGENGKKELNKMQPRKQQEG